MLVVAAVVVVMMMSRSESGPTRGEGVSRTSSPLDGCRRASLGGSEETVLCVSCESLEDASRTHTAPYTHRD